MSHDHQESEFGPVELQWEIHDQRPLPDSLFQQWIDQALTTAGEFKPYEMVIRVVDAVESQDLNRDYRGKDKPTNVLSFPSELPDYILQEMDCHPLGDLVICWPVVEEEAQDQHKAVMDHLAHLVIHGTLHLLGYDHELGPKEAERMESLEIQALAALGIADPYQDR